MTNMGEARRCQHCSLIEHYTVYLNNLCTECGCPDFNIVTGEWVLWDNTGDKNEYKFKLSSWQIEQDEKRASWKTKGIMT